MSIRLSWKPAHPLHFHRRHRAGALGRGRATPIPPHQQAGVPPQSGRAAADPAGVVQHPGGQRALQAGDDLQGQGLGHRLHRQPAAGGTAVPAAALRTTRRATRSATPPTSSATFTRARLTSRTTAPPTTSSAASSGTPRRISTPDSGRPTSMSGTSASAPTPSTSTATSSTARPTRSASPRRRSASRTSAPASNGAAGCQVLKGPAVRRPHSFAYFVRRPILAWTKCGSGELRGPAEL